MVDSVTERESTARGRGEAPSGDTMHAPLVSVCMAAYNVERFVSAALGSVLRQTHTNLEVIVVDDGSTDHTCQVAQSFSDARLRVVPADRNLGGYQAMNKAVSMASAEFVAVYHSDDVYDSRIVAAELAFLRAHPEVGAVFTWSRKIDGEGRLVAAPPVPPEFAGGRLLDYDAMFRYLVRKGSAFVCPTFMTRRSVLETIGLFDAAGWDIVADVDMWIRIARRFPLAVIDEPLHQYRVGNHQWTARDIKVRRQRDRFFDVIDHYIERDGWDQRLSAEDLAEYRFRQCDSETMRATTLLVRGDEAAARESLRNTPFPWPSLRAGIHRRKLRLLGLRAAMFASLAVGARAPLAAALRRIGP